jgi:hypothetical protein
MQKDMARLLGLFLITSTETNLVRSVSQTLQWMISVLSSNSYPIISPPIIITLCTLVLALNMIDVAIEYLTPNEGNEILQNPDQGHGQDVWILAELFIPLTCHRRA